MLITRPRRFTRFAACLAFLMAGATASIASPTTDVHGDLIASSLDWPVGHVSPLGLITASFDNQTDHALVVYDDVITDPGMAWMRLYFGRTTLDRGSVIQITSLRDGEQQILDARTLAMWSNTTAYFNGDALRVELIAGPNSSGNQFEIEFVAAEEVREARGSDCGICGPDDRAPVGTSSNNFARIMPVGCTATIYNESSCFVTAGHCLDSATVLHFNVPDSNNDCSTVQPPVADQFPVTDSDGVNGGVGNDYGALTAGTNSDGQTPYERYGSYLPLAMSVPSSGTVDITGYGVDTPCSRSQTEQHDDGPINSISSDTIIYSVDVTYGNSGSSIVYNNQIIGVVTHCSNNCENYGTRIDISGFQSVIASVCDGDGDPDAPDNDECDGAIAISTGSTEITTIGATSSVDNFDDSLCSGTYLGEMSADVWYTYLPIASGTLTVATCDSINFDSDLVVYAGTCDNKTQVACNGDGSDCSGYSSHLTVEVSSGTSYLIRLGGWSDGAEGTGQLMLDLEAAPDPTGACCSSGLCSIATSIDCAASGGEYQGDSTDCNGDPCDALPPMGGCCVATSCDISTLEECDANGGSYLGDGSDCSGTPCDNGEPGDIEVAHSMVGFNLVDSPDFNWTVDVYVTVPEGERLDAVAGNSMTNKVVTSTGLFYQDGYGGPTSTDVNPALYPAFPDLQWDSRVTIGAMDSSGAPFDGNELGSVGIDFTDFENGYGLWVDNGVWFVLPTEEQGASRPFLGTDCQQRHGVLVARLTTFGADSQIQFQALLQGRDAASVAWQQTVDMTFGHVATEDCNTNGISDTCDIANGTSPDANNNGIPDECEGGCNGDFNGDGQTNIDDVLHIISDWGTPYGVDDLLVVLDDYGCGG